MQALPRPDPALADLFLPDRTSEIAFWTELALSYGRVLVNWHCGGGELGLALAINGLRVVGIDPEPGLIDVARARERAAGQELQERMIVTWLTNEPRLMKLPGAADFLLMSDNALGLYSSDELRSGLLTNAFYHLRPGGALGLSIPLAPASGVMHNTALSGPLRRLPPGFFARRVSNLKYDADQRLLAFTDDILVRDPVGEQRFRETGVRRLYTPAEIAEMLRAVGFTGIGMWGGWDRRSIRQASSMFIVRAERPVERTAGIAAEKVLVVPPQTADSSQSDRLQKPNSRV